MAVTSDLDPEQQAALEALLDAVGDKYSAEASIIESVTELRKLKVPWSVIGETLGMSRQAAHEKYRRSTDEKLLDKVVGPAKRAARKRFTANGKKN